jgi:hypothetical protein
MKPALQAGASGGDILNRETGGLVPSVDGSADA